MESCVSPFSTGGCQVPCALGAGQSGPGFPGGTCLYGTSGPLPSAGPIMVLPGVSAFDVVYACGDTGFSPLPRS